MVTRSQVDRLAGLKIPDEQLVEGLARALYMTHRRDPAPTWENASAISRDWVRAQARAGLTYLRSLTRPWA
jgi:hypothetical protein